jgi:hypothetical protein
MEAILMKKLITATAAAAFILGTGFGALAEDSKQNAPTQLTPTQQQMKTQSTDGKMKPAATTGAGMNAAKGSSPSVPAKDNPKDSVQQQK